ncbi:MAG: hypothetical protein ACOYXM_13640 [Actinomycetota bacterium]
MAAAPADRRPPPAVRRATRAGAVLALLVFAALVSEGTPSGLLARGPFSSDFFDAQAHSLLDGRLDVNPEVAGIEGFVHDGRTHLYFGLVPAILRLPVAAMTDRFDGRLSQVSMLVALAVAMWAASRLLWRAREWRAGAESLGPREPLVFASFTAAVGLSSPLLFLAARPVVYHETELWGVATTLVALDALLGWWSAPSRRSLMLASAAATVALNTRASVGSGAVAALALTAVLALAAHRVSRRAVPVLALAVLVPVLLYGSVNQARFGHPLTIPFRDQVLSSFDANRQATLDATGGSLFGPEFAPTALVTYLRPDGVEPQRLFPWVTFRESRSVIGDATFDMIDRAASLPVVAPSLLLLAVVGLGSLLRRGWRDPWLAAAVGSALGLVSTLTIAFIANRYLADFTPLLVLLAAIGTWSVADWLRGRQRRKRRLAVAGLALLSMAGITVSIALALQSQRLFILPTPAARHQMVSLQYDLHDRLGGGAPPGVRRATTAGAPGPRGDVVLLDECRGLYWSDGDRWWPLELGGDDGFALRGRVRSGTTVLLDAGAWRLTAVRDGGEVTLAFEHEDGTERRGEPLDSRSVDGEPLTVAIDRVNSALTVTRRDEELLVAWLVDLDGAPPRPGPSFTRRPAPTPLCDDLRARLER